jgi:tRNA-dihydrouridine synthase
MYAASLRKKPDLTAQLLSSMKSALPTSTAVSLKCRIALLKTSEDEFDPYCNLCRYLTMAEEAGVYHVVLHARPANLSGLSSVQNSRIPLLEYGVVESAAVSEP